jgi:large subunit ribosomal protein L3
MKTLLGTKVGMTQILSEDGVAIPVTLIKAGPVTVTQVKTVETDGYTAVQLGYGNGKNLSNAVAGHVKKAGVTPKTLKEVRVDELGELKVGDAFDVAVFEVGENVDVTGVSKGKGFAGTIKRHNYNRQRKTHGGKGDTRKVGSIGSMYPQRVFKGKTMAGHMGHEQVTVKNLTVAYVDATDGVIGLKGAVPGPRKGLVRIAGEEK